MSDLAELGAILPDRIVVPAFMEPSARWGGLFVLEGARLSGDLLSGRVLSGCPCDIFRQSMLMEVGRLF
jgi:hypothetical protein